MTIEETRKIIKQFRDRQGNSSDDIEAFDLVIEVLEQQPCDDCIRELIREFDNKHLALFDDYMEGFNEHTISEIIDYMWDMHNLIEDIKYRLPDESGGEDEDSD